MHASVPPIWPIMRCVRSRCSREPVQALSEAYEGKVVMQLAAADLPVGASPKLEDLMQWRASHRQIFQRRLLKQGELLPLHAGVEIS